MRSSLRSPNLIKKRRKRRIFKALFLFFSVSALIVGPAILTGSEHLEIRDIKVSGNSVISDEQVIFLVNQHIRGNYLGLYSKRNIAIYPKNRIEKNLLSEHKRLKSAEVSLSGWREITVSLEEREPYSLWCRERECFFMDDESFIFDRSPTFSTDVYVVYEGGIEENPIGSRLFESAQFEKFKHFLSGLAALSFNPAKIHIEGENIEINVSGDVDILVRMGDDFERSLSNFESVINDQKLGLMDEKGPRISSIDLRFGNKVFYKKDE